MSLLKRKCANCRFLADAGLSGNGWCTHPKRQVNSDVRILVRKGELACRNSWGGDLWESPSGSSNGVADAKSLPSPPDIVLPVQQLDDEVTSVVDADSQRSPTDMCDTSDQPATAPPDDRIVAQGSFASDGDGTPSTSKPRSVRQAADDINHLAHADQHERAQVMARGARDAILRARERHRQRSGHPIRAEDGPPLSDDAASQQQGTTPQPDSVSTQPPDRAKQPEDQLLQTQQRPSPSSAIDPFRRSYNDVAPPVPTSELPQGAKGVSHGMEDRTRFDSVPELREDIVLPRRQRTNPTGDSTQEPTHARGESTLHPDTDEAGMTSYDRVLEQARQIKAAAKATRENRTHRQSPRLTSLRRQSAREALPDDDLPGNDFTEAPATDTHEPSVKAASDVESAAPASHLPKGSDHSDLRDPEPMDMVSVSMPSPGPVPVLPRDDRPPAEMDEEHRRQQSHEPADDAPEHVSFDDVEIAWSDADVEPAQPQPATRRRSWLHGFGRRRQDTPPPVAMFPLGRSGAEHSFAPATEPDDSSALPAEAEPFDVTALNVSSRFDEPTVEAATEVEAGWTGDDPTVEPPRREPPPVSSPRAEGTHGADTAKNGTAARVAVQPTVPDHLRMESRPSSLRVVPSPAHAQIADDRQDGLTRTVDMEALRERLFAPSDSTATVTHLTAPPARPLPVEDEPVAEPAIDTFPAATVDVTPREGTVEFQSGAEFDIRAIVDRQSDLLDMSVHVAPHIPRMCETCRDFRPAENGERGWCTNAWAFTHRRMVNAADRPCQSSIGCWWLPDDSVWLTDEDLIALDEPTPLVDAMLAQHYRRRVGER